MRRTRNVGPACPVGERGYAMAALLVAMSVAAIMMTVVMPVWKQMAQREKEEELVFRGQQYVRALRLFGMKYANASPPNLDVLVEQRFIRKKFKDPITNDDFQVLLAGQALPGTPTAAAGGGQSGRGAPGGPSTGRGAAPGGGTSPSPSSPFGGGVGTSNTGTGNATPSPFGQGIGGQGIGSSQGLGGRQGTAGRGVSPIGTPGAGTTGGIIGVVSKSKDKSIRLYNGRNHYNEWAFVNTPQTQTPGAGAGGVGTPGQRGRQGQPTGAPNPFGSGIGGQRGPGAPNPQGPTSPSSPFPPPQPQPGRPPRG